MKDKWGFLREHPNYAQAEEMRDKTEYMYHNKDDESEIIASIALFDDIKYSTSWAFEQWDDEKTIRYRKIEATPSWFQELYQQAEKKRSEMTRLRDLFEKKAPSKGVFQGNPEHETDIDDIFAEFLAEDH